MGGWVGKIPLKLGKHIPLAPPGGSADVQPPRRPIFLANLKTLR
jgi:hypothetical protein